MSRYITLQDLACMTNPSQRLVVLNEDRERIYQGEAIMLRSGISREWGTHTFTPAYLRVRAITTHPIEKDCLIIEVE